MLSQLFAEGKSLSAFPVRLIWTECTLPTDRFPVQVAFAVSKRNYKRAVDRNQIKRHMREAYRLNKNGLYNVLSDRNKQVALMVLYTGKGDADFVELREKIILTLQRLTKRYEPPVQ